MTELVRLLNELTNARVFCGMVYLQEAHADDLWNLGYGIKSHSSVKDRRQACLNFLAKHQALKRSLQVVALDTLDDSFLHRYGAWPERYFFVKTSTGQITWTSQLPTESFHDVRRYAIDIGLSVASS